MFGPRSNQSPESMMFGSNKLERGIIFVTVSVLSISVAVLALIHIHTSQNGAKKVMKSLFSY